MRRLGRLGTAVLFVASAGGVGIAAARAADPNNQAREAAPLGAQASAPVALLSRLHHAAQREMQLGDLAEAGGSTAASRQYGAQLSADFRELDQRIVATAASAGVDIAQLSAVQAGENVVALRRESDDFGRLANERGATFDRDFWVAVAQAQSADSDMLTTAATREPALLGLVSEMSELYDRSSRRALGAASTPQAAERLPPDSRRRPHQRRRPVRRRGFRRRFGSSAARTLTFAPGAGVRAPRPCASGVGLSAIAPTATPDSAAWRAVVGPMTATVAWRRGAAVQRATKARSADGLANSAASNGGRSGSEASAHGLRDGKNLDRNSAGGQRGGKMIAAVERARERAPAPSPADWPAPPPGPPGAARSRAGRRRRAAPRPRERAPCPVRRRRWSPPRASGPVPSRAAAPARAAPPRGS